MCNFLLKPPIYNTFMTQTKIVHANHRLHNSLMYIMYMWENFDSRVDGLIIKCKTRGKTNRHSLYICS